MMLINVIDYGLMGNVGCRLVLGDSIVRHVPRIVSKVPSNFWWGLFCASICFEVNMCVKMIFSFPLL